MRSALSANVEALGGRVEWNASIATTKHESVVPAKVRCAWCGVESTLTGEHYCGTCGRVTIDGRPFEIKPVRLGEQKKEADSAALRAVLREVLAASRSTYHLEEEFGPLIARATALAAKGGAPSRPRRIVLCGSTKFKAAYMEWNARLTLEGHIVMSVGLFFHADGKVLTTEQKNGLDSLHFSKIDLADEVFVLDVGGYIGESTRNEIRHAKTTGKPVTYLSRFHPTWTEADCKWWRSDDAAKGGEARGFLQSLKCLGCGAVLSHFVHEKGEELGDCPSCHATAFDLHTESGEETHEQRWTRLGEPFGWCEKHRAYCHKDYTGISSSHLSLPTVAAVDGWIAAQPKED